MDEQTEYMQIKLDLFASKLSQAYDLESQYIHALNQKDKEIAKLKEEINVLKNTED